MNFMVWESITDFSNVNINTVLQIAQELQLGRHGNSTEMK